jgi:hypothetical protein
MTRLRRRAAAAVPLALLTLLAACGQQAALSPAAPATTDPETTGATSPPAETSRVMLVPDGYDGRFRFVGTVLESPEHGPQLCGAVATSYPPQCGGPDVVGWTWKALTAESANGTTWGSYVVVGTWDGRLHLTEPARTAGAADQPDPAGEMPDFTSPCPPPMGGWRPVNPALTTAEALERLPALAEAEPDFAGFWLDQPPDANNDPTRLVANVKFTGDLKRHERELRRVWGGALCVSAADRTQAELNRVQKAVDGLPGFSGSGQDVVAGVVDAKVHVATERQQRELDERFGAGVVRLSGVLQPIDG